LREKRGEWRTFDANAGSPPSTELPLATIHLHDVTELEHLRSEMEARESRWKLLDSASEEAHEETREELARFVHDQVGQDLALASMQLARVSSEVAARSGDRDGAMKELEAIKGRLMSLTQAVQHLSSSLRPSILDDLGLFAAIEWLLGSFESRTGIRGFLRGKRGRLTLDKKQTTGIFRFVQEALTTAVEEGQVSEVRVSFQQKKGLLVLGLGFKGGVTAPRPGAAQTSVQHILLRQRASRLGAELHVQGEPGGGMTLVLRLPLDAPEVVQVTRQRP